MSSKRYREQFTFWLDLAKNDEFEVAEQISKLKQERSFVGTVRDGIRLILNLRQGKLDVLFELFPWVKVEFIRGVLPQTMGPGDEFNAILARLDALREHLHHSPQSSPIGHSQALEVPRFDMPTFEDEDDDDTIVIIKDTSTDATQNMLDSLFGLMGVEGNQDND